MSSEREKILKSIITLSVCIHVLVGVICWRDINVKGINIFHVTAYFNMDIYGWLLFIFTTSSAVRIIGMISVICGYFFFYKEFNNPQLWDNGDITILMYMALNCIALFVFINLKMKRK